MAMSDLKDPPPKPSRIRTTINPPARSGLPEPDGNMINGQTSPTSKTPAPPRPAPKIAALTASVVSATIAELEKASVGDDRRNETLGTGVARPATTTTTTHDTTDKLASSPSHNAQPRTATAPVPPPKPKRISLAPQPKAKPLSLQSAPLQLKETSRPTALQPAANATTASPAVMSSSAPKPVAAVTKPTMSSVASPTLLPITSAPKKPNRSPEHSTDESHPALSDTIPVHQRHRRQMPSFQSSSPPSAMSMSDPDIGKSTASPPMGDVRSGDRTGAAPGLAGARSRLRSVSDARASTSLSVSISRASRTSSLDDSNEFRSSSSYTGALISPTYPSASSKIFKANTPLSEDDMNGSSSPGAGGPVTAEKLTSSLQKIQALAQGQTDRMKQINYAEKRADLAEAVHEKSSLWRARGAEWGGLARKAWEDRGGMGGIAGGFADRWKRRGDGVNDGTPEYPRYGEGGRIFGLPLEDAVRISKISATTGVPAVVTRCIEYLDIMGIEEVGLYRVPGSTINVNRLKTIFDSGNDYDFLQKGNEPQNPHDVATLLKLYLRELPIPIIPSEAMPTFTNIDFASLDQQPAQQLRNALRSLPLENYILLGTLCLHLSNLADFESCTKMNISNLGVIFCPTLHIGSLLFKNLLGGDGSEKERRKSLLLVWADLDTRHEEMENIQMIKDFESGLQVEENDPFQDGSDEVQRADRMQEQGGSDDSSRRSDREHADYDLLDLGSSPPQHQPLSAFTHSSLQTPIPPFHPKETSASSFKIINLSTKPKEPPLDLYDELVAREIDEAASTPLIDLSVSHDLDRSKMEPSENLLRRHAREPAMNRRSESPPPFRIAARHERLPAVSIR